MKKIVAFIAVAIMSVFGVLMLPAQEVAAADCNSHFLGLPAWYDNLPKDSDCNIKSPNGEDGVKAYVWAIVFNIVGIILGVMGYLAIAFVMWGGIQYKIAQGDPGKVARGKKTITNAFIGLIISMSASILSGAISAIIQGAAGDDDGANFYVNLFNKVFFWGGVVAVIMIVYGGIQYITSTGNPAGVSKAKTTILYSIIGLLVVLFAAAIIYVLVGEMPE